MSLAEAKAHLQEWWEELIKLQAENKQLRQDKHELEQELSKPTEPQDVEKPSLSLSEEMTVTPDQHATHFHLTVKQEGGTLVEEAGEKGVPSDLVEAEGGFWKKKPDGGYEQTPYCVDCRLPMRPYPPGVVEPEFLACPECNTIAPFKPDKIKEILARLPS